MAKQEKAKVTKLEKGTVESKSVQAKD